MSDVTEPQSVTVGGVEVTQERLERMCAWLQRRGTLMPQCDTPALRRFMPLEGTVIRTAEEYVYTLLENPEINTRFTEAFTLPRKPMVDLTPPADVLRRAGFPATFCDVSAEMLARASAFAGGWLESFANGRNTWAWVMGGTETERTLALAGAAVMVAHSMERGALPRGAIEYVRAFDLCETVNSADLFGSNSKWNALHGPKTCALLLLDCLGGERAGAHEAETLALLLEAREREALPTVIASEIGLSLWVDRYIHNGTEDARRAASAIVAGLGGHQLESSGREAQGFLERSVIDIGNRIVG